MEDVVKSRLQLSSDPKPQSGSLWEHFWCYVHCGSNNNPIVGQLVDVLKSNAINGLDVKDLSNTNCEDDKTLLLDNFLCL